MPVTDLPIVGYYDKARFTQFNPSDTANWYLVNSPLGKKKVAMYPVMGRKHINFLNQNRLIFDATPRQIYKSINYWYVIAEDKIFRIDAFYNQVEITEGIFPTNTGDVYFTYIVVSASTSGSVAGVTYALFSDGQSLFLYREDTNEFGKITDSNLPKNPLYLATFGNRVVVSTANSSTFGLSEINLNFNATFATMLGNCFTINMAAVFAQEAGIIRQMGVLQNTLYIFTDFTTGIWSNIPSSFLSTGGDLTNFPFKKNTTYDWDFGMAEPNSLDIDFGRMTWLAKNRNGILQIMNATGQKPEEISTEAIDVLLQRIINIESDNPLDQLVLNGDGFLFDYENTVFYRFNAGIFNDTQLIDQIGTSISIEYNFRTQEWHRCIESNGDRCRIQDHIFFNNKHFVTVENDTTVYEMSGRYYTNDVTNPDQTNPQATDYYIAEPFRYERVTPIICAGLIDVLQTKDFYAEFITDYVEIDFVWGEGTSINSTAPYDNAVFIVSEQKDTDGNPIFVVSDQDSNTFVVAEPGNLPVLNSAFYHRWFKPHIELYFSDDGGISFKPKDVAEFSQIGVFQWRMRWYQLGPSRNRVYKLVCVSPSPIVVLGASMEVRRASGGAA